MRSKLTGSDLVEIELTVVDVRGAGQRVVIAPVRARLCLLVEQSARGAEEPEVPDAAASHPHTHVEGLAARLSVSVVSAENTTFAVETLCSPCGK